MLWSYAFSTIVAILSSFLFSPVVGAIFSNKPLSSPEGPKKVRIPVKDCIKLGIYNSIASISSISAIKFISMPTQILAKTIKILPGKNKTFHFLVALFSLVGGKRKYSTSDYITASIATLGMIVYNIEEVY